MVRSNPSMRVAYDERFDILEIFAETPKPALTVEIVEDVYLHVVPSEKRVIGMTIHRFRTKNANYMLPFEWSLKSANPAIQERLDKAFVTV